MGEGGVRWALAADAQHGSELPLGVRLVAGRALDAPIRLPDGDVLASRYHAAFEASTSGVQVVDLDSLNGVFVNGAREPAAMLLDGDVVRLGNTAFRVLRTFDAETFSIARTSLRTVPAELPVASTPYVCELCHRRGPPPAADHEPWWTEVAWICSACAATRRTEASSWEVPRVPRVSEFELLRFIARGAMGAVYEARHLGSGIRAAVKVMLPDRTLEQVAMKRFTKEQKIIATLVHPRVVRSLGMGTSDEGELYVATEFLARGDADALASVASDARSMVAIAADMFEALAYAHANGFVHRDVKPSNLLLAGPDPDGRPRAKLTDFGLAKSFRDIGGTILTQDGEIGGSAAFVAPEQLLGFRDVGPTADVYAAATTLYYLLTGELPLSLTRPAAEATETQLCLAALAEERVPIAERRPSLHPYLAQWIDLLVCRDHTRRSHLDAASVAATLNAALDVP